MIKTYDPQITPLYEAFLYINENVLSKLPRKCWAAGGFCRSCISENDPTPDIDLYTISIDSFQCNQRFLIERDWEIVNENQNSCLFVKDDDCLDLVKIPFPTPIETIASFDFTVSCAAIDDKNVYMHDRFLYDVKNKQIKINNANRNPDNLIKRIKKYESKGYKIDPEDLKQIIPTAIDDSLSSPPSRDALLKDWLKKLQKPKSISEGWIKYDYSFNKECSVTYS